MYQIPALIIGSIVKVCPAFITPTALFPARIKEVNTQVQMQWVTNQIEIVQ